MRRGVLLTDTRFDASGRPGAAGGSLTLRGETVVVPDDCAHLVEGGGVPVALDPQGKEMADKQVRPGRRRRSEG